MNLLEKLGTAGCRWVPPTVRLLTQSACLNPLAVEAENDDEDESNDVVGLRLRHNEFKSRRLRALVEDVRLVVFEE